MKLVGFRGRRGEQGLTLIELMMATALSSVVFMLLYVVLDTALDSYALGQVRSNAVQTARQALSVFAIELQNADEIYYATSDSILFRFKTIEQITDVSHREITRTVKYAYRSGTGTVFRDESTDLPSDPPESVFATGVSEFNLRYWDAVYAVAATMDAMRYVEVDLRVQVEDYQIPLHNLVTLDNPRMVP
jgi:prepilin-type N-terminal cleavage/methylation domain-containing protein